MAYAILFDIEMISDKFTDIALRRYASSLKAGTASLYECLRFFQNSFRYRADDRESLVRQATLALIRHDPLFLVTDPHGCHVEGLSEGDIQACIDSWTLDDEPLAAFLEGHLRMAMVQPYSPDHEMTRQALQRLESAQRSFGSNQQFLQLYVEALRILGDERYVAAFDELLEHTDPEWHSHALQDAMSHAVEHEDWMRYDTLRERWGAMPKNSHICECATNYVSNIDGLRSLDRGDQDSAIHFLRLAVSVPGCPHLNTGAASVELANELLDHKLALSEVGQHLEALEQYCETEETAELRSRLADQL